jgi:undecaprenyl-diphosphatase
LIITEWLYDISEHGLEAFLHFPTALAIFIVFFWTFWAILKDKKTWPLLLAAIIPAGIIGFLFGDALDAIFYSPIVVGINQLFWGCVMWWTAMNYHKRTGVTKTDWKELTWVQALKIGFFQVLALIPGTSRSGITTLAGMSEGLVPSQSAAFSFISGFPLIAAASGIGFLKLLKNGELLGTLPLWVIFSGMALSLFLGIIFMKLFTSKHALTVMKFSGLYRIILGILIFIWLT